MNWKLIFQLSLFGVAMGTATVFVIPSNIEPLVWLVIFVICAYFIAKGTPDRRFLHGLLVSIVNSVWITTLHVVLVNRYLAGHPQEVSMMQSTPFSQHPRAMMLFIGPIAGIVSGLILGLFAWVAGKLVKSQT
jgi:hypothetical protein